MAFIKISDAFKAGADWIATTIQAFMRDQALTCMDTVQEVRDNDFEQTRFLYVKAKGAFYRLNLSSTAADDGDTVLRDNIGRRYEKVAGSVVAQSADAHVADIAARAAYDGEPAGFFILVDDVGDGRAAFYTMGSGGSADWIGPAYLTGADGADGAPGSSNVVGTSTSSVLIGTGTKTFTIVESDRGWGVGARLRISSDANGANFMEGVVTAYSANTLEMSVDLVGGSGTLADWTINLAGEPGTDGANGADGADGAPGVVQSIVAGTNVTVDATDPANPIVSSSGGGGDVSKIADRTALKALTPAAGDVAILTEAGREGTFLFDSSDLSTEVTADTEEALYVPPSSDTTGASGAWVRQGSIDGPLQARWAGAAGDDSTDDTAALVAGFNTAKALSLSLKIGAGVYRVANASGAAFVLDMDDLAGVAANERKRPDVKGEGLGVTVIHGRTGGQYAMQLLGGTGISSHQLLTIGDMSFKGVSLARGLHVFNSAFIKLENMQFHGLAYGLSLESCLSSEIEHCHFYSNTVGTELKTGTGFSGANALVFNKCIWGLSTANAVVGLSLSTNLVFNDCNFEGNGLHGDSFAGGLVLTFAGTQGNVGTTFKNCWFESNKGAFDVQLINGGANRMTHVFIGCNFIKGVSSAYVTNHIQSFGPNRIVLIGCTFDSYNGYTPDAGRPVVTDDGNTEWICIGCTWMNPVEQGKLYNAGSELFSNVASDLAKANVNTAQAIFGAAQDTFTLLPNTTYEFEGVYIIDRAAGTTSHTTDIGFGGTVSPTSINFIVDIANPNSGAFGAVSRHRGSTVGLVTMTAANTSATEQIEATVKGTIRVGATGGTLIPQFKYSAAPGGAPTVKAGSYFRMRPKGTDLNAAAGAVA